MTAKLVGARGMVGEEQRRGLIVWEDEPDPSLLLTVLVVGLQCTCVSGTVLT